MTGAAVALFVLGCAAERLVPVVQLPAAAAAKPSVEDIRRDICRRLDAIPPGAWDPSAFSLTTKGEIISGAARDAAAGFVLTEIARRIGWTLVVNGTAAFRPVWLEVHDEDAWDVMIAVAHAAGLELARGDHTAWDVFGCRYVSAVDWSPTSGCREPTATRLFETSDRELLAAVQMVLSTLGRASWLEGVGVIAEDLPDALFEIDRLVRWSGDKKGARCLQLRGRPLEPTSISRDCPRPGERQDAIALSAEQMRDGEISQFLLAPVPDRSRGVVAGWDGRTRGFIAGRPNLGLVLKKLRTGTSTSGGPPSRPPPVVRRSRSLDQWASCVRGLEHREYVYLMAVRTSRAQNLAKVIEDLDMGKAVAANDVLLVAARFENLDHVLRLAGRLEGSTDYSPFCRVRAENEEGWAPEPWEVEYLRAPTKTQGER